ncbi:MFS transporter [Brevibacillus thermoruber]|uniref:MFS transporter n=1 Tax=Brevibacillus thermoruber TaxID=33942 RepID=UPI004041CDD7
MRRAPRPFIDRWSRKWMMVCSQWSRGVVFLLPLIMLLLENLEPWHIYAVQIVTGLIQPLYVPASLAITPTILPKHLLHRSNSYMEGTALLMSVLAPALGGIVTERAGVTFTLLSICICFMGSGCLLLFLQESRSPQPIRATWLQQFLEGITYFLKQPILVWLGVFLAFVQFGVGVTMVVNLPYVTEELHGSYAEYGYVMASFPLGYVLGSMLVGRIQMQTGNRRMVMIGSLLIGGLTFMALGINPHLEWAILTETIAGMAMPFFHVYSTSLYQQTVPNEVMGSVFSVRLFIIRSAMPLGVLAGSSLSEWWGVRPLYLLIGVLISTMALIGMVSPFFRFLDEPLDKQRDVN